MMVPSNRLLWWTGIVVVPCALLVSLVPGAAVDCLLAIGLWAFGVSWDAWRGWQSRRDVVVTLPEKARLFVGRDGCIELSVAVAGSREGSLRLGVAWPDLVGPEPRELSLELSRSGLEVRSAEARGRAGLGRRGRRRSQERSPICVVSPSTDGEESHSDSAVQDGDADETRNLRIAWPCKGRRRGRSLVEQCFVETVSPWCLWQVRQVQPQRCELRLYPDLFGERHRVASVFLRRGAHGVHRHRWVGKGREFEQLREYTSGDSYEDIHWKATARRRRPVTKLFRVERTQEVYVLVDSSRLSGREVEPRASAAARAGAGLARGGDAERAALPEEVTGVNRTTVLERYVTSSLLLATAAEREGDRFGLLTFADRVQGMLRACSGVGHFNVCRDMLLDLQALEAAPDFEELFAFVRVRLRHRALLVVLTSLDDPVLAETFERGVDLISRQHLVLVQQLRPGGVEPLFGGRDPETEQEIYQRLSGHLRWHELRQLQVRLQRRGVRMFFPEDELLSADVVRRYMEVKEQQAL